MSFESRQALPGAGVVELADGGELAFAGSSWRHLNAYVAKIEHLPDAVDSGSAELDAAVNGARSQVEAFGSPRRLRKLVHADPGALAGERPPATLYAGIVWLAERLHLAAVDVVSTLQILAEAERSSADRKQGLQKLGGEARDARAGIGPVAEALASCKSGILEADHRLSAAHEAAAADLQAVQESVGGLQAEIDGLRKKIDGLGFLHKKKKRELEERLASLKQELTRRSAGAELLRAALRVVEPAIDEGHWLEQGLEGLGEYLDRLTRVWTAFGSRMAQLAVDASDDQLGDADWVSRTLGVGEAVEQWQRIGKAAQTFVSGSLVDFTND